MAQEATEMAGPKTGSFCWTEIASSDAEKCMAFYSNVFGWNFKKSDATDGAFAYNEFSTGGDYPAGGLYQISPEFFGGEDKVPPPHFMSYVAVDDVDENAKLAVELGGKIIREPMDIPNTGRFAVIQDPTGGMIATFKMKG
jgi:predicted enzyme related to lactoylglutathione lyase